AGQARGAVATDDPALDRGGEADLGRDDVAVPPRPEPMAQMRAGPDLEVLRIDRGDVRVERCADGPSLGRAVLDEELGRVRILVRQPREEGADRRDLATRRHDDLA